MCALSARLAREGNGVPPSVISHNIIAADVLELSRLAKRLHRYAERDCNQGLSDSELATVKRYEHAVSAIAARYVARAEYNGDPRGAPVLLKLASGITNSFGGDGYVVPY
jgi:hypothetical protein